MTRNLFLLLALLPVLCLATFASTQEKNDLKDLPPVVVETFPRCGSEVDAAKVKEIKVTFSKEMMDRTWSWVQVSRESFPRVQGKIHYQKTNRTCVLPVTLEPGKSYVLWINQKEYQNFKDSQGISAVPYLLYFRTKK